MWIGIEEDMKLACLEESCISDSGTIEVRQWYFSFIEDAR